ncbi:hypothetical protein DEM27_08335 [Metarhizobium album]|uniref:Uncharacterized protein n=1 Tax=Metarhizobium album TaxID=2182425 RepID=A0A2U2DSU4_9HYPH|nr:hypothetical protein [Rhizobium album]PWE56396.1 hypothetical protein DEM27_08335 [Rhizobium album]
MEPDISDDTSRLRARPVLWEHWCEHPGCKAWGSLGYDVGHGESRWYCFEHCWTDYRKRGGGGGDLRSDDASARGNSG